MTECGKEKQILGALKRRI